MRGSEKYTRGLLVEMQALLLALYELIRVDWPFHLELLRVDCVYEYALLGRGGECCRIAWEVQKSKKQKAKSKKHPLFVGSLVVPSDVK